jgi:hypothetical protein
VPFIFCLKLEYRRSNRELLEEAWILQEEKGMAGLRKAHQIGHNKWIESECAKHQKTIAKIMETLPYRDQGPQLEQEKRRHQHEVESIARWHHYQPHAVGTPGAMTYDCSNLMVRQQPSSTHQRSSTSRYGRKDYESPSDDDSE